LRDIKEHSIR